MVGLVARSMRAIRHRRRLVERERDRLVDRHGRPGGPLRGKLVGRQRRFEDGERALVLLSLVGRPLATGPFEHRLGRAEDRGRASDVALRREDRREAVEHPRHGQLVALPMTIDSDVRDSDAASSRLPSWRSTMLRLADSTQTDELVAGLAGDPDPLGHDVAGALEVAAHLERDAEHVQRVGASGQVVPSRR